MINEAAFRAALRAPRTEIERAAPRQPELVQEGVPLTPDEIQILWLAAHGWSYAQIAATVFRCESTVKLYLRQCMVKLRARNRVHAVHLAHQRDVFAAIKNQQVTP